MNVRELRSRIAVDEDLTRQTLALIDALVAEIGAQQPRIHDLAAYGTYLHNAYTGAENVLKHFARYHKIALPASANWHEQLVMMFAEPPLTPLPRLFDAALMDRIAQYRGFRHIARTHYAVRLNWARMQP